MVGVNHIDKLLKKLGNPTKLRGDLAFKLYDTYGFPLSLITNILSSKGVSIDLVGYEELLEEQQNRSKKNSKRRKKC